MAYLLAGWTGVLLFCHWQWGWVPILDSANLAFHEAGHPLFGFVSARLAVYGGTIMQLLMPALCAVEMHREQKYAERQFCVVWFGENLLNIARYMADARAQQLPLVGGLDPQDAHDWTRILRNWGVLAYDTQLANVVRVMAVSLMLWAVWNLWTTDRKNRTAHESGIDYSSCI